MLQIIFLLITFIVLSAYFIILPQYDQFTSVNLNFYYINLVRRVDRKNSILKQLKDIGVSDNNIIRIDAVSKKFGHFGCALSHLKTLGTIIINDPNEYAVVLEDDFVWKYPPSKTKHILNHVLQDKTWDICLLSCNGITKPKSQYMCKVVSCQTTSGYIIRKRYLPILLKHWQWYVDNKYLCDKAYDPKKLIYGHLVTIDDSWKILQKRDNDRWIITNPILGKQSASYSDIEKRNVDYNV